MRTQEIYRTTVGVDTVVVGRAGRGGGGIPKVTRHGFLIGLVPLAEECWDSNSNEHSDDDYHYQEFDQREASLVPFTSCMYLNLLPNQLSMSYSFSVSFCLYCLLIPFL